MSPLSQIRALLGETRNTGAPEFRFTLHEGEIRAILSDLDAAHAEIARLRAALERIAALDGSPSGHPWDLETWCADTARAALGEVKP